MRILIIGYVLLQIMKLIAATCVLESEFGFILNCNFKKSGLFRVRNLGGLKAHFGLGFSFGDELGFGESLGNLEGNRRRALNYKTGFINKVGVVSPAYNSSTMAPSKFNHVRSLNHNTSSMTEAMFLPLGVPTFRPIPKNTNNLIRRNDMVLPDAITNNEMTQFYYLPEKSKGQRNVTNMSDRINTESSYIGEQTSYNDLSNISNTNQNRVSNTDLHELYDKNKMQIAEVHGLDIEKHNMKKIQSTEYNTAVTKKSSRNNSAQRTKRLVVMNAPKEYYPSGYDKNFDDNFKSKVDLPPTDFACTEQKYFPGLYANIDLGCMVFHVCAITDGGIIMKSFLCPESTLFDQSILKCNWWFYVDCNNSTYDSNIPISKSYQLMKSLSYFSNFTMTKEKDSSQKNVITMVEK